MGETRQKQERQDILIGSHRQHLTLVIPAVCARDMAVGLSFSK